MKYEAENDNKYSDNARFDNKKNENKESSLISLWNNREYRSVLLTAALVAGIILSFRYLLPVVVPFLCAFFLAGCMRPVVDFLVRHLKLSEKWASAVVFLVAGILLILAVKWGAGTFLAQMNSLLLYYPFYREQFLSGLGTCCSYVDQGLHLETGASLTYALSALSGVFTDFQTTILPALTSGTAAAIRYMVASVLFLFIMVYAFFCMLSGYPRLLTGSAFARSVRRIWDKVLTMIFAYLRAEGTIALIQALVVSIGLRILHFPYYLPLGLLVGLVDALPVFGSGTVLVPWAVVRFLLGDTKMGIGLLILYGLCIVNRQLLEPRLLGKKLNMSTLMTLFMMYVGYQLFGIFGFILGPIGYLLGREIYCQLLTEENNDDREG